MAPVDLDTRSNPLFDTDEWPITETATIERKPSEYYLRQTPAAPLTAGTKTLLWLVALAVAALLVLAVARGAPQGRAPSAHTESQTVGPGPG